MYVHMHTHLHRSTRWHQSQIMYVQYVVSTKPLGTEPLHTNLQAVDWLLSTGLALLADHSICTPNSSNTELYNYTHPLWLYVYMVCIHTSMHNYTYAINIPQWSRYVGIADSVHSLIDMVVDWKSIHHTTLHHMPPTHGHTYPTPPHTCTTQYINTHTLYARSHVYICNKKQLALLTTKVIHLLSFVLHTCSNFIYACFVLLCKTRPALCNNYSQSTSLQLYHYWLTGSHQMYSQTD